MLNINRGSMLSWERQFLALDVKQDGTIDLHVRTLNIFQRANRYIFGEKSTYGNTIWNVKKSTAFRRQFKNELQDFKEEKIGEDSVSFKSLKKELKRILKINIFTQNILIIGQSRSGKSCAVKVLKNVTYTPPPMTLFRGTVDPETIKFEFGGYNTNLIDTPGFQEQTSRGVGARTNAQIRNLIIEAVKQKFKGEGLENVDKVIFTLNTVDGFSNAQIDELKEFLPYFSPQTKKIFLVTRAEDFMDAETNKQYEIRLREEKRRKIEKEKAQKMARARITGTKYIEEVVDDSPIVGESSETKIINQLRTLPQLSPLIQQHFAGGDNILFSGCLDQSEDEGIERKLENILKFSSRLVEEFLPEDMDKDKKQSILEDRKTAMKEEIRTFVQRIKAPKKEDPAIDLDDNLDEVK